MNLDLGKSYVKSVGSMMEIYFLKIYLILSQKQHNQIYNTMHFLQYQITKFLEKMAHLK